jgi:hypothetical protein
MRFNDHNMMSSSLFQECSDELGCNGNPFMTVFLVSFTVEKVWDDNVDGRGG